PGEVRQVEVEVETDRRGTADDRSDAARRRDRAVAFLSMALFRARRRDAVHVAIVDHEIEGLDRGIHGIAAVYGLASIADDDVLHDSPDHIVENRDAE